jgi:hypothetical protein
MKPAAKKLQIYDILKVILLSVLSIHFLLIQACQCKSVKWHTILTMAGVRLPKVLGKIVRIGDVRAQELVIQWCQAVSSCVSLGGPVHADSDKWGNILQNFGDVPQGWH